MRTLCEYCGGNTKIDDRGNCAACGAPDKTRSPDATKDYAIRNLYNNMYMYSVASTDAGSMKLMAYDTTAPYWEEEI